MKRSVLAILTMLCIGETSHIHADEDKGVYVHGFGGFNFLVPPSTENVRLETKPGYAVGGSIGYKFSKTMRLEGELSYRENQFDKFVVSIDHDDYEIPVEGNLTKWTYMGNILFDIPVKWMFTPYFGGGVGGRRDRGVVDFADFADELDESRFESKENGITYQGIAGLSFQCFEKSDFRFEYRMLNSGEDGDQNHTLALTLQRIF